MSQAATALKELYEPIRGEIASVEEALKNELANDNPFVDQLLRHSTKFQGKRVRPALVLHGARIFGEVSDIHVQLGAVVEMLHMATLVHDDVLDEALLRRRVTTLNSVWGNEASILFGDYLFAKAYTACARLHNREANMILAKTVEDMCVGELSQIGTKFNFDITEEDYLRVIRNKTASLFATACRLGSVNNGAEREQVETFARYGDCFGTAFQIIDDCLDITGSEEEMGKSLGTDLDKGKLTLPIIKLLQDCGAEERRSLQDLLASGSVEEKREKVTALIRDRNILAYCEGRAADLVEEAHACLRSLGESVFTANLHTLADFVIERRT